MPSTLALSGQAFVPYIPAVAALRIAVFREFPYLYDGDLDYEKDYLAHYVDSPDSVVVLSLDGGRVVGASTGLPLADADNGFQAPFKNHTPSATDIFYLGESVLLPEFRGRGIGHAFFDQRESHARALGRFTHTAFCAVDRSPDDPRRPASYRDLGPFWAKRGYTAHQNLTATFHWKEIDTPGEVANTLTFYLRPPDHQGTSPTR